jgi:putative transposase
MLPPTLLPIGESFRELRWEPLSEFGGMEVRLLKMILCAQEDRVLPAPPHEWAYAFRQHMHAVSHACKRLCERRFEGKDLLIVYLDGIQFGQIHVLVALGVDTKGYKHVLGLREGSSENATVVKDLLTDIVSRGLDPGRRRLFVIDGSKALRKAIDEVFGMANPIQRCRNHKVRNVLDYLPKDRQENVRCAMKAAFQLPAEQGMAKLKKLSEWLAPEYPSAAESLLEGLAEMFTINRLELPAQLRRCLASTNIIESPNAGIREKTGRVTHWRDGQMVLRWTASALLTLEKRMRRIMSHQQLWMLEAKLQDHDEQQGVAKKLKSA